MIKAVLFDMDGILYDSEQFYMEGTVDQMRSYGYTGPTEQIYRILGTDMKATYAILYELLEGTVPMDTLVRNNEEYFGVTHPVPFRSIMFEGIPDALKQIRAWGLKTACCSATQKETVLKSLRDMGIIDLFDYIESGENMPCPKPAPDIYLSAMKCFGLTPEECLVYEDSAYGIAAGKNAGMKVVAREDNRYGQNQSQADIIVKDVYGLMEIVAEESGHDRSN